MSARKRLTQAVERLNDAEAAAVLELIVRRRREGDDLDALLGRAPRDDEPSTRDEDAAADVARRASNRRQTVSLEQARKQLGIAESGGNYEP